LISHCALDPVPGTSLGTRYVCAVHRRTCASKCELGSHRGAGRHVRAAPPSLVDMRKGGSGMISETALPTRDVEAPPGLISHCALDPVPGTSLGTRYVCAVHRRTCASTCELGSHRGAGRHVRAAPPSLVDMRKGGSGMISETALPTR